MSNTVKVREVGNVLYKIANVLVFERSAPPVVSRQGLVQLHTEVLLTKSRQPEARLAKILSRNHRVEETAKADIKISLHANNIVIGTMKNQGSIRVGEDALEQGKISHGDRVDEKDVRSSANLHIAHLFKVAVHAVRFGVQSNDTCVHESLANERYFRLIPDVVDGVSHNSSGKLSLWGLDPAPRGFVGRFLFCFSDIRRPTGALSDAETPIDRAQAQA